MALHTRMNPFPSNILIYYIKSMAVLGRGKSKSQGHRAPLDFRARLRYALVLLGHTQNAISELRPCKKKVRCYKSIAPVKSKDPYCYRPLTSLSNSVVIALIGLFF
jgi:hypothetical protein